MTFIELETYRKSLGHTEYSMAKLLDTPYSTYRDWEDGTSRIPGAVGVAVKLLAERDKWVTITAIDKAMAKFDRDHPQGIVSEGEYAGKGNMPEKLRVEGKQNG